MSYLKSRKSFLPIDVASMRPKNFNQSMVTAIEKYHQGVLGNSGYREQTHCLLCGSESRKFEFSTLNGTSVYQCDECTLAYVDPFPVNSADVYSTAYFDKSLVAYDGMRPYRIERFGMERITLIQKYVKSGKLLDVGCGVGWFLEAAKKSGFDIYGQEISKELADFTSEELGIAVFNEALDKITHKFDVITMFDLIEHVMDPKELIIQCRGLLNPGGIIVAFTPNYDSLGIQVLKENSSLVCPPAHLTYFTKESVEKLADLTNMSLVHLETKGMDIADIHAYYNHLGKEEAADAFNDYFDKLQPIVDQAGAANHMRFIYRKV
jgi:2-polyprenyl-3-methyl-5-hydroxy-6-metoxy-1,4-benzoquinol methylase